VPVHQLCGFCGAIFAQQTALLIFQRRIKNAYRQGEKLTCISFQKRVQSALRFEKNP
jgi:hypothetical protein